METERGRWREEPEPDGEFGEWRAVNGVRRTPAPSGESRGRFIVLEGIDGSGKSEQSRRLAAWLRRRGHEVVETREPSDTEWGRRYRAWARGEHEASPETVLRYFIEDRREHVAVLIQPAVEAGKIFRTDCGPLSTPLASLSAALTSFQCSWLSALSLAERSPKL